MFLKLCLPVISICFVYCQQNALPKNVARVLLLEGLAGKHLNNRGSLLKRPPTGAETGTADQTKQPCAGRQSRHLPPGWNECMACWKNGTGVGKLCEEGKRGNAGHGALYKEGKRGKAGHGPTSWNHE